VFVHERSSEGGASVFSRARVDPDEPDVRMHPGIGRVRPCAKGLAMSREGSHVSSARRVTEIAGRRLTRREQDIVGLLLRACSNREIATRLGVSEHTVKIQIGKLYSKFGVKSRLQLVMRALRG
jgi:DNA-binding NarL/FixJ family response regulator